MRQIGHTKCLRTLAAQRGPWLRLDAVMRQGRRLLDADESQRQTMALDHGRRAAAQAAARAGVHTPRTLARP